MGKILARRIKQQKFSSPEQEALLNLLVASGHIRTLLDKIYTQHGITHGQYNVLRILRGVYPNGYPRCDIIERMLEPSPDVTRLIDRLLKAGLVQRKASKSDKRLSVAVITQAGLALLAEMDALLEATHQFFSQLLTPEECLQFSALCEKIYAWTLEESQFAEAVPISLKKALLTPEEKTS
ncbi:MAG: MarR family transcriptional regulator [Rhodothermia bacterium]|nr:MarR family transcriptional regulator [Rhodothermia bacterium]